MDEGAKPVNHAISERRSNAVARLLGVLFALPTVLISHAAGPPPVRVVLDTDMDTDCDDAAALGMLHVLADRGEAEIVATIVSARSDGAADCTDAINTFFGRPDLPIGRPARGVVMPSKYARQVADAFPHDLDEKRAPDAVDVYREALERQPDGGVTIVTLGDLTNLADLLKVSAEGDRPSGRDLIARKVRLWVCMGGNFVGRPARDDLRLGNNNFTSDGPSSLFAIRNWPGRIAFVGREIGSVPSGLAVGANLSELPEAHPVRAAYTRYFGGPPRDRHVADQTALLFAVRGLDAYWGGEIRGRMELADDLTFRFVESNDGPHSYVVKAPLASPADDRRVELAIEALMLTPPVDR